MRRTDSILMNSLFIFMVLLLVQLKPTDGNGDSTDEETAFPSLKGEEAAPAKTVKKHVTWDLPEEEPTAALKKKACSLVDKLFRRAEKSITILRNKNGIPLFSLDNPLKYFVIISDDLATKLKNRYTAEKDPRVYFQPKIRINIPDSYSYRTVSIDVDGSKLTVACQGDICTSTVTRLAALTKTPCTKYYYICLNDFEGKWTVELGRRDFPSTFQVLQPIPIMESLIRLTDSTETKEPWLVGKASINGRTTIKLHEAQDEKKSYEFIPYWDGSTFTSPMQDLFYKSVVHIFNLHPGPIALSVKPIRKRSDSRSSGKTV